MTLNQGRKWATDEPLRAGMGRIRGLVEPQLGAAHAGKLTPAQYRELATQVENEVGGIVANCKLEPKADAMLHLVIADIGAAPTRWPARTPRHARHLAWSGGTGRQPVRQPLRPPRLQADPQPSLNPERRS
jgi:hypothetical protein